MEPRHSLGGTCDNGERSERDTQGFEHLTCMDSGNLSLGQNDSPTVLPITTPETHDPLTSQSMPETLSDTQALHEEQFHLLDQNGEPIQCDLQSLGNSTAQMTGMEQVVLPQEPFADTCTPPGVSEEKPTGGSLPAVRADVLEDSASNYTLHSQASLGGPKKSGTRILEEPLLAPLQPLSCNTPMWACRLRSCEKIGDSYRGYCVSETELESVLTFHKQQTQTVWGTRQSPSPAKPATRLMWKSQYVPYDGIPFVNAAQCLQRPEKIPGSSATEVTDSCEPPCGCWDCHLGYYLTQTAVGDDISCHRVRELCKGLHTRSRAVVMECQYGPRRKGFQLKKISEQESRSCHLYKATCPARIYIKKVQKFPDYRVPTDPQIDRKTIRMEQEKAFTMLKKNLVDAGGVLRWYVQLPTQQAHQYHEPETPGVPLSPSPFPMSPLEEEETVIRDENCALPSRLHPQVAHKIQELVSQGVGQVYAVRKQLRKFVERELFKPDEVPERHNLSFFPTVNDIKNHIHEVQKSLQTGDVVSDSEIIPATLQWTTDSGNILRETVTVTFAEGNLLKEPITSKMGISQTQTSLSPESLPLFSPLSSFQPKVFTHVQALKLQPRLSSPDGTQALVSVNSHPSSSLSGLDTVAGDAEASNHSLLLGQSQNLGTDSFLPQNSSTASPRGCLPGSGQNLVAVDQLVGGEDAEDAGNLEGNVKSTLLGDAQTIPIHILDSHPALVGESLEDTLSMNQVKQEPNEPTLSTEAKTLLDCKKVSAT